MAKIIKVSRKKIKAIKVGDLANAATMLSVAIFGLPLVFTGTKPYTADQILVLITAYNGAKSTFNAGGNLQKPAYTAAKLALVNCLLGFATYVDDIAEGDVVTLALSTLPTTEDLVDYLALIVAGATADGVVGTHGYRGQLFTDCTPFGPNVSYLVIVSEGDTLPDSVVISTTGQVKMPAASTLVTYLAVTNSRKKSFIGLTPGTLYYVYYFLVYGDYVGRMSDAVEVTCGS